MRAKSAGVFRVEGPGPLGKKSPEYADGFLRHSRLPIQVGQIVAQDERRVLFRVDDRFRICKQSFVYSYCTFEVSRSSITVGKIDAP